MSVTDPIIDDARGAAYHIFFLKVSKICTSKFWAIKNATPEPIAILIEIISEKLVDTNKEQLSWNKCNLDEIYQPSDIRDIFGVEPSSLNTSYSKRFYKLSEGELQKWHELGKSINTSLPFNDVLIIYSQ